MTSQQQTTQPQTISEWSKFKFNNEPLSKNRIRNLKKLAREYELTPQQVHSRTKTLPSISGWTPTSSVPKAKKNPTIKKPKVKPAPPAAKPAAGAAPASPPAAVSLEVEIPHPAATGGIVYTEQPMPDLGDVANTMTTVGIALSVNTPMVVAATGAVYVVKSLIQHPAYYNDKAAQGYAGLSYLARKAKAAVDYATTNTMGGKLTFAKVDEDGEIRSKL